MKTRNTQNRMLRKLTSTILYRNRSPEFVRGKIVEYLNRYGEDPRINRISENYEVWLRERAE